MAQDSFLSDARPEPKKKEASPFEVLTHKVSGVGSRLRVLEERYETVRKKTQMTDENLLTFERDMRKEIKVLSTDMLDIKRTLNEINEKLMAMSSELKETVKQTEIQVLEKYIDFWEPMNFVRKEDIDRILSQKSQKKK